MLRILVLTLLMFSSIACPLSGQDADTSESSPSTAEQIAETTNEQDSLPLNPSATTSTAEQIAETTNEMVGNASEQVGQMAGRVDDSAQAREISAGILQPIYALAESLEFPAFHWIAFALMVAGVLGFALQLVLGKLVALTQSGFSFSEILSDTIGLLVSLIGLVLTTQAAAQNSTFTQSAFAVISATIAGAILGFMLYLWGQRQELQAIAARKVTSATTAKK